MKVNVETRDPHHNVFYYYSGRSGSTAEAERQLENNTTKALINTLGYCSDSVQRRFLRWLRIETSGPIRFSLQAKSKHQPWMKWMKQKNTKKILLGIIPPWERRLKRQEIPSNEPADEAACDAWIYGKGWVVLVESKVKGPLDTEQIARHLKRLGTRREALQQKSWKDIYRFFRRMAKENPGPVDAFLTGQLCEYLKTSELVGFTGITAQHFDYFNKVDSDRNPDVRNMMGALAEEIKAKMDKDLRSSYPEFRLGKVFYSCWGMFFKGKKGQEAHQTVELWSDKFQLFANVETQKAVQKLRSRIDHDRHGLEEIISKLPGYFVMVQETIRKRPRKFDYIEKPEMRLTVGDNGLDRESLRRLVASFQQVRLPQFSIRWEFTQEQTVKYGANLASEIVKKMKELHPFVEFANRS